MNDLLQVCIIIFFAALIGYRLIDAIRRKIKYGEPFDLWFLSPIMIIISVLLVGLYFHLAKPRTHILGVAVVIIVWWLVVRFEVRCNRKREHFEAERKTQNESKTKA